MPARWPTSGSSLKKVGAAWTVCLLGAGLCICLLGLLSGPRSARAGLIVPCGQGLERVKAFEGHAYFVFDASAQGEIPGTGDARAITMKHRLLGVHVYLKKVVSAHGRFIFEAPLTGGGIGILDTLVDADGGFVGTLSFEGALHKKGSARGSASLSLDRHRKKCNYAFGFSFAARANFSGAPEVAPDVLHVGSNALSELEKIPDSLKLSGNQTLPTFLGCGNEGAPGCSDVWGGWTNDFGTLALCHSVVAVGCADDDTTPVGEADLHWFLKPVFEK